MNENANILLDYIFDLQSTIGSFISDDVACIFNRPHHGLGADQVKKTLVRLNNTGYIFFLDTDKQSVSNCFINTSGLSDEWFVSLTKKGGDYWESTNLPEWKKYVVLDSDAAINGVTENVVIQGGSKEVIFSVISDIERKFDIINQTSIEESIPWKATYWKTLSTGYSVGIEGSENLSEEIGNIVSKIEWKQKIT